MGDLQASSRTVIGAAEPPDRRRLSLRPRETLPNVRFRPGKASRSHDSVPFARPFSGMAGDRITWAGIMS